MSNETKITLVTLVLTNIVTIVLAIISFIQKKWELKNSLEIIEKQKAEDRIDFVRNSQLEIVQNFAYSAGNILTSIESPLSDSDGIKKIPFNKLSEFDKAYYHMFILLNSDEDKQIFKKFQYEVRSLAGLPKPDGCDVFEKQDELEVVENKFAEGYIEPPLEIYEYLDQCLTICHNLADDLLSNSD